MASAHTAGVVGTTTVVFARELLRERKGAGVELFVWIGATIGACLGLLHGAQLYRSINARGHGSPWRGLYTAVWAFALWTLFGSYVLAFWLIGIGIRTVVQLLPKRSSVQ